MPERASGLQIEIGFGERLALVHFRRHVREHQDSEQHVKEVKGRKQPVEVVELVDAGRQAVRDLVPILERLDDDEGRAARSSMKMKIQIINPPRG